jgi:Uma2 family endonuclease
VLLSAVDIFYSLETLSQCATIKCIPLCPIRNEITMAVAYQVITADELLRMPDNGFRYELVQGELRRMSPAGFHHGRLIMNIATPLDQHVRTQNLGTVCAAETGFLLTTDPDTVRAADIAFIRQERITPEAEIEGYWPGAPDLAVEVVSPHDLYTEVDEKVTDWLDAGTRMVVVVNPRKRTVTVYRSLTKITVLREQDSLDGSDVVSGWTLAVAAIFA